MKKIKTTTQDRKAEISFFDKYVEELDYDVFDDHGYKRIISEFSKYVDLDKQLRVLDMGCGTGAFTAKLDSNNFDLHGIDISPKSIELAQKKYPNIFFSVGDIESTNFEDSSFDIILLSGVLHHFPDFSKVIKECYRLLKKGGKVFAYDPHRGNPIMWLYRCKDSPFYSSKGVTENEEPLSRQKIEDTFNLYGFSELNVYSISGITYGHAKSKFASILLPIYNVIERYFYNIYLHKKIGSFLITIAKK